MSVWEWLAVGMVVGVVQVLTQWWTINRLQPDRPLAAVKWTAVGALGRLMVTAVLLLLALSYSIGGGLLAFFGWWLGRWPLIIWLHR